MASRNDLFEIRDHDYSPRGRSIAAKHQRGVVQPSANVCGVLGWRRSKLLSAGGDPANDISRIGPSEHSWYVHSEIAKGTLSQTCRSDCGHAVALRHQDFEIPNCTDRWAKELYRLRVRVVYPTRVDGARNVEEVNEFTSWRLIASVSPKN